MSTTACVRTQPDKQQRSALPPPSAQAQCRVTLEEVWRVLKPGGKFILIGSRPTIADGSDKRDYVNDWASDLEGCGQHLKLLYDPAFEWSVVETDADFVTADSVDLNKTKMRPSAWVVVKNS